MPKALTGQERVLVPLGDDLDGLALNGGEVTLDVKGSVVRLPSGATIKVSRGDQTEPMAPPALGAAEAAGSSDRVATEASWTTSQGTAVVHSTVPVRAEFLDDYARTVVPLPRSLAESLVSDQALDPVSQPFRIDGLSFTRTLHTTTGSPSHGLAQTLTADVEGSRDGVVSSQSDLGGDLSTPFPQEKLVLRTGGRYRWLVMAAGGLDVQVSGDDRADRIGDELTGATYLLLTDEDGDDQVELTTSTQGEPTVSTFTADAD